MRFDLITQMANETKHWPRFILAYFPACDQVSHHFGLDSPQLRQAIRNADDQIGRICRGLEKAGVLDRTLLVLVTDHGQAPMRNDSDGVIDATGYLASRFGMRVTDKRFADPDFIKRFEYYNQYDVVVVPDAPRLLGLHLRPAGQEWYDRPADVRRMQLTVRDGCITAQALAEDLAQKPYCRFAAVRAGHDRVELVSQIGEAMIEVDGTVNPASASTQPASRELAGARDVLYRYTILRGQDPLRLGLTELAPKSHSGKPVEVTMPGRQWLARTIDGPNPGVVSQIATYFHSARAGDIVVFAETGYGFAPDESGHGSTTAAEMRVPLVFAGPGVTPGVTDRAARIQSVMPTIVTALGFGDRLNVRMPLDGPVLRLAVGEPASKDN